MVLSSTGAGGAESFQKVAQPGFPINRTLYGQGSRSGNMMLTSPGSRSISHDGRSLLSNNLPPSSARLVPGRPPPSARQQQLSSGIPILPPAVHPPWMMVCGGPASARSGIFPCGGFQENFGDSLTGNPYYYVPPMLSPSPYGSRTRRVVTNPPSSARSKHPMPRVKDIVAVPKRRDGVPPSQRRFSCESSSSFRYTPPTKQSQSRELPRIPSMIVINKEREAASDMMATSRVEDAGSPHQNASNLTAVDASGASPSSERVKSLQKLLGGDLLIDRHGKPPPMAAPYYASGALKEYEGEMDSPPPANVIIV